ncbi:MAG: tetratricopeptide repeat protein, partial [bacterium]|nr:tetratricopeptide repeat protein [bacterium]
RALVFVIIWIVGIAVSVAQNANVDAYDTDLQNAVRLYSERHLPEASRILERLTSMNPERKEAYLWLGKTNYRLEQWPAAQAALETYTQLAPTDPDGPRVLARTYLGEANHELAVLWFKKALDLAPDNDDIRWELERTQRLLDGTEEIGQPAIVEDDEAKPGFWRKGVGGLLGARKALWTRIIAIAIYGIMSLLGSVQSAAVNSNLYGSNAGAASFFSGIFGGSFFYILFWGIPSVTMAWVVAGVWIFVLALISAGVASQS